MGAALRKIRGDPEIVGGSIQHVYPSVDENHTTRRKLKGGNERRVMWPSATE